MGSRNCEKKFSGNDDLGRGLCNEWKREMGNGQMGSRYLPVQLKTFRLMVE